MGSSAGQGRVPAESHDRCISGPERNMPWEPAHVRQACARWLPPPRPGVCASYTCDGFGNLTRLCPIVSVHLVVGRNKNHLDFFPDWMIRIYFLFLVLLLFLPHPHPTWFLSLPSFFFPFPHCWWGWQGGFMLLSCLFLPSTLSLPPNFVPFSTFFLRTIALIVLSLPPYLGSGLLFLLVGFT